MRSYRTNTKSSLQIAEYLRYLQTQLEIDRGIIDHQSIQLPENWEEIRTKAQKHSFEYAIIAASDGSPIEGATVRVRNSSTGHWYSTKSNKEGLVCFTLPTDEYQLKIVYKKGFRGQRPDSVFRVPTDVLTKTEIKLEDCPVVYGVVRDTDDNPVTNARVFITAGVDEQISDSAGKFTVQCDPRTGENNPEIIYAVAIHQERNLAGTVRIFKDTRNVDINLAPAITVKDELQI